MPTLECYFDCSSPWTYLGFHNVQPLASELAVEVTWHPILVGGLFNTVNPSVYQSRAEPVPLKHAYMLKDLQDWARHSGIRITWPVSVFPVNSVKAMRGCVVAARQGKLVPYATAAFEAYWGDDRDISRDDVLAEVARTADLDPTAVAEAIATPEVKDALKRNTEDCARRGGFGSPTFFVDGDDMYFGNDRLPLIRDALIRAGAGR
ncbi:MAG TPA: 2-hydroxychromene-2-carboxylate isomerase [Alphaproteobacteria bacterium]|nr:2-hydroxychromene-2-carboxylate isomerase [Alphaproteobacteria bacterium]